MRERLVKNRVNVCEASNCDKEEVFNHFILALMKVCLTDSDNE